MLVGRLRIRKSLPSDQSLKCSFNLLSFEPCLTIFLIGEHDFIVVTTFQKLQNSKNLFFRTAVSTMGSESELNGILVVEVLKYQPPSAAAEFQYPARDYVTFTVYATMR